MDYSVSGLHQERILLVGGCGFIGHHLALALREAGAEVLIVDNLGHNNFASIWSNERKLDSEQKGLYLSFLAERHHLLRESECRFVKVDAREQEALRNVVSAFCPTKVVHMAAISNTSVANRAPDLAFDHNLTTLKNTLESCRVLSKPIKQFVFFSSSMVYGDFPPDGVTEETQPQPKEIYGALKLSGEHIVKAYSSIFEMPYTIVRPSAVYGPRCVGRRVAQIFLENAIQGRPIKIEGDGNESLDFTCVEDLVQGTVRSLTKPESLYRTLNLTFGESRPIRDLAMILTSYFPGLQIEHVPRDGHRPVRGTLDITMAREVLQYEPAYPLEKGYAAYIEWYLQKLKIQDKPLSVREAVNLEELALGA